MLLFFFREIHTSQVCSLMNFLKPNASSYLCSNQENIPSIPANSPYTELFVLALFPLQKFTWCENGFLLGIKMVHFPASQYAGCSQLQKYFFSSHSEEAELKLSALQTLASLEKAGGQIHRYWKLEEILERGGYGQGVIPPKWWIWDSCPGCPTTHHYSLFCS